MADVFQKITDTALVDLEADLVVLFVNDHNETNEIFETYFAGQLLQPTFESWLPQVANIQNSLDKNEEICLFDNLESENDYPLLTLERISSMAVTNIINNNEILGVLFYMYRTSHMFYKSDERKFLFYSHISSLAIDARLGNQKQSAASNLVHDILVAETLGIHKLLQVATSLYDSGKSDRLLEVVKLASEATNKLHDDTRRLNDMLREDSYRNSQDNLCKLLEFIQNR